MVYFTMLQFLQFYLSFPVYAALPEVCREGETATNHENTGYIATGLLDRDMAGLLCRWSIQVCYGVLVF